MNFSCKELNVDKSLKRGVLEIPGEPTIVINELLTMFSNADIFLPCLIVTKAQSHKNIDFGRWFEVKKFTSYIRQVLQ